MTFKCYLMNEAFNFKPKSIYEIHDKNMQKLFTDLKILFPEIETPIAIDLKLNKAKVKKSLKNEIQKLPTEDKNKIIKNKAFFDFGNGSSLKDRRSMSSQMEEIGEKATIQYILKPFSTPKELGDPFFIENEDAFNEWFNTFKTTKEAVETFITYSIKDYKWLHDATDNSKFMKVLKKFMKKTGLRKHNWSPADLWIIKKSEFDSIVKSFDKIINALEGNELISIFNIKIYHLYKKGYLYPVSLKQVLNSKAKATVTYTNIPKEELTFDEIAFDYFICNFKMDTKEIGTFRFINKDTNKPITIQNNAQPPGFALTQTEITNDGTISGGKAGKVPTYFVSNILEEYGYYRINSSKWFGTKSDKFKNVDNRKIDTFIQEYKYVISNRNVQNTVSLKEFKELLYNINSLTEDEKERLMMKLQGLRLQYFFLKNNKDISSIINRMIFAAKKIGKENPFFIKIY